MRKLITLTSSLLFLLVSLHANAQTLEGCVPNISPRGTTLSLHITGSGMTFSSVTPTSVQLTPVSAGAGISTTSIVTTSDTTLLANVTIPAGADLGDYDMKILPHMSVYAPRVFHVTDVAAGTTGRITGHVWMDENANCLQDGAEADLSSCVVGIFPDSLYVITSSTGEYAVDVPPGTYSIRSFPYYYKTQVCPAGTLTSTITAPGTTDAGNDLGVQTVHVTDGAVWCNLGPMRPGFTQWHSIMVTNVGSDPLFGTLNFTLDPVLAYVSSIPAGTYSAPSISWPISGLASGGMMLFNIETLVPVGTPLGTTVACMATLTTVAADVDTANNTSECDGIVIGSFDPNDKTVWNQDMELAEPFFSETDSLLIYRIRFQNTGTASAINVIIRDTLDSDLDASTVQTLATSHLPVHYSINGTGNLEWRFPDIYLPDSTTDEPGSHGFVTFSVKRKPVSTFTGSIENTAAIYFDFNDAVITNTTTSSIFVSSPDPVEGMELTAYPNPAHEQVTVQVRNLGDGTEMNCRLLNTTGQMTGISATGISQGGLLAAELDLSSLSPGIYLLETTVAGSRVVQKVVVMR